MNKAPWKGYDKRVKHIPVQEVSKSLQTMILILHHPSLDEPILSHSSCFILHRRSASSATYVTWTRVWGVGHGNGSKCPTCQNSNFRTRRHRPKFGHGYKTHNFTYGCCNFKLIFLENFNSHKVVNLPNG